MFDRYESMLEANASVRLVCKSFLQSLLVIKVHAAGDEAHPFLKWPDLFSQMRTVTLSYL